MVADAGDATAELWRRLARPFPLAEAVEALIGLAPDVVGQLAGTTLCLSVEAETLLGRMPSLVRGLSTSVNGFPIRSRAEIRGAVLWSETISARAASFGEPDLFVCAAPQRDYDTPENRVLVHALDVLADGGRAIERVGAAQYDDEQLRRARANARSARLFLDHPALSRVTHERVRPRALKRVRGSKAAERYRPAIAVLERAAEPLGAGDLVAYCDRRTRIQHEVVVAILEELAHRGMRIPSIRVESGALLAGPLSYVHPRRLGARDRLHGILLGDVLLDVPERLRDPRRDREQAALESRADGRHAVVVLDPREVPRAVDVAVRHARRQLGQRREISTGSG